MVQRYKFPLEDQDYYAAQVSFHAFEIIPPSIRAFGKSKVDTSKIKPDDLNSIGDNLKEVINPANIRFTGNTKKRLLDKATLYLPQSISFQDGVEFDEFSLGRVGGATEAAVNNGASLLRATGQGLQQNINAIMDVFNASPTSDIARLAASRVSKVGGEAVQGGVQSALRVTTNPNKRLLFKEVRIREFSFNFKLIPTSQKEAEEIKRIVTFFRTELYPDDAIRVNTSSGISIPIGYKFPNQFNIVFKHRDKDIAHKILPSYLTSMQTTYNPTGMGFFEDGNFTETEITLNFRESRALSKEQIQSGF